MINNSITQEMAVQLKKSAAEQTVNVNKHLYVEITKCIELAAM